MTDARAGKMRRVLMPLLALAVLSLAGFLLFRTLSRYDSGEVVASIIAVDAMRLLAAGMFAAASYLSLTASDWLALRYAGRPLPYRYAALASFVGLSIGHTLGFAALSTGAIRYRFYSRWGLKVADIANVVLFCGFTVGLGLAGLGGLALLLRPDLAQEILRLDRPLVLALGAAAAGVPAAWLVLAATLRQPLRLRSWTLQMPSPALAAAQILIGSVNFGCVAASLHQTISAVADVPYLAVASVYVIGNTAALITHVPGGLGVIESAVVFLLPHADLIGAVLVFRFVYYLVPFGIGACLFGVAELAQHAKRRPPR